MLFALLEDTVECDGMLPKSTASMVFILTEALNLLQVAMT